MPRLSIFLAQSSSSACSHEIGRKRIQLNGFLNSEIMTCVMCVIEVHQNILISRDGLERDESETEHKRNSMKHVVFIRNQTKWAGNHFIMAGDKLKNISTKLCV